MVTPTRSEVVSLLRKLLRTSQKFTDYNLREYAKRRTLDSFRHNDRLSDPESLSKAYIDGVSQLEIAQRQAVVYSRYNNKVKSILEMADQPH